MRHALSPVALALTALVLWPEVLPAQNRHEHNVEKVTAADVGPYRPEERPQLARAEQQIVERVNRLRQEQGLEPLSTDRTLAETAAAFAGFMARTDLYGHTADGNRPSERASEHGYEFCIISENIAYQFRTRGFETAELARRFVEGWKNSPPHRENLLDPDVTETGVGIAQSEQTGVFYAVQMFGRPKSLAIEFSITNPTEQVVHYQIEDRTFELPPRYTRTHTRCRAADVELLAEAENDGDEPKSLDAVRPENGDEIQITIEAGQVRFDRASSTAQPTE
ncbi:MAG TPA: CAP domain-containing protein [Planctomycetaceae bacterium]|nr:CAP domain-containing protein [Planctomycetaceae bacterium]